MLRSYNFCCNILKVFLIFSVSCKIICNSRYEETGFVSPRKLISKTILKCWIIFQYKMKFISLFSTFDSCQYKKIVLKNIHSFLMKITALCIIKNINVFILNIFIKKNGLTMTFIFRYFLYCIKIVSTVSFCTRSFQTFY